MFNRWLNFDQFIVLFKQLLPNKFSLIFLDNDIPACLFLNDLWIFHESFHFLNNGVGIFRRYDKTIHIFDYNFITTVNVTHNGRQ